MTRKATDRLFIAIGALIVALTAVIYYGFLTEDAGNPLDSRGVLNAPDSTKATNARRHAPTPRRADDETSASVTGAPRIVQQPTATTITGQVLDESDEPIEGVAVSSELYFPRGELNYAAISHHTHESATNKMGLFTLTVPGHGAYHITTWHPLYAPVLLDNIRAGETQTIHLSRGGAVHGKVINAATKKPIFGAVIESKDDKTGFKRSTSTDETGRYKLMGLHPDSMKLSVHAKQLLPTVREHIVLNTNAPVTVDMELSMGKIIRGTVWDDKKQPVANALIASAGEHTRTNDIGEFSMAGFSANQQSLEVTADGFLTNWRSVNMAGSRSEATIQIILGRGKTISGVVLDEGGNPIHLAAVQAFESWGGESMWAMQNNRYLTLTNEEGRYSISGLSTGSWSGYRIRASKEEFAPTTSKQIKFGVKGPIADLTVILTRGGQIQGRVLDDRQTPLSGAKVTLKAFGIWQRNSGESTKQSTLTDEDGRYAYNLLSEGKYSVSAVAPGFANTTAGSQLVIAGSQSLDNTDIALKRGYVIRGIVTRTNGDPIEGASVTIKATHSSGQTETDTNGAFVVPGVGEGPYSAEASCSGYVKLKKKDLYANDGVINFELRQDGFILGRVVDAITNEPIRKFKVKIKKMVKQRGGSRVRQSTRHFTSEDGEFRYHTSDGEYTVTVSTQTHIQLEKHRVTVIEGQDPLETIIRLHPGGAIEGWVKDHLGRPVSGVEILLRDVLIGNENFRQYGRTEPDGYFFCPSVREGTYDISAKSWGQYPLMIQSGVSVHPGELSEINLNCLPPSRVTFILKPEQGVPNQWLNPVIRHLGNAPIEMNRLKSALYTASPIRTIWFGGSKRDQLVPWLREGSYELTLSRSNLEPVKLTFFVSGSSPIFIEVPITRKKRNTQPKRPITPSRR